MRFMLPLMLVSTLATSTVVSAEDRAASDSIVDVEFDDLAVKLDLKTYGFRLEDVPKKIRKLRGRRIRLHGYMLLHFKITGIKTFSLRDRPFKNTYSAARLIVTVILRKGTSTSDIRDPVVVEGRFSIKSIMDDDYKFDYYVIDDAVVGKAKERPKLKRVLNPKHKEATRSGAFCPDGKLLWSLDCGNLAAPWPTIRGDRVYIGTRADLGKGSSHRPTARSRSVRHPCRIALPVGGRARTK